MGAEVVGTLGETRLAKMSQKREKRPTYQANHLDAALFEFILQFGECTDLCGAYGGEVGWVGEEDCPAVADELVEIDLTMGSLGLEVGCYTETMSNGLGNYSCYWSINLPVDPRRNRGCSWGVVARNRRTRGCARGCGRTSLGAKDALDNGVILETELKARKLIRGRIDAMIETDGFLCGYRPIRRG